MDSRLFRGRGETAYLEMSTLLYQYPRLVSLYQAYMVGAYTRRQGAYVVMPFEPKYLNEVNVSRLLIFITVNLFS